MAFRLETSNVLIIENRILNELELWNLSGKEAEAMTNYIAGVNDMANAVIEAIKELGGK